MKSQFNLLATKRLLPLFITQFLGAFNDNVFKNALVVLITYYIAEKSNLNVQIMVTAAAGIFILPFFLFSATAGQLAEKYEKSSLMRIIKFIEIILMAAAVTGFFLENIWLLMVVLFCMGTQSTFFGTLKYSVIPEHLKKEELIAGNALIEAGTFLAILLGTIVGGLTILAEDGVEKVSILVLTAAVCGYVASYFVPRTNVAAPKLKIGWNIAYETWKIIQHARNNKRVFMAILGISWFWAVGAILLSQFPVYAKNVIGGDERIITLFLTTFSIGTAIGSLFCNHILKGEISAKFVPLGCLGISIFMIDLCFASHAYVPDYKAWFDSQSGGLLLLIPQYINVENYFLISLHSWRIIIDLLIISISAGIFVVPLYAIMQARSSKEHVARNVASNNVLNALFMVLSAVAVMIMFSIDFTVTDVFATLAIANLGVFFWVQKKVEEF